ncbi:MAG: SDR family oxidoreductase [Chloroflexi bacterium]|nr:SDR family oxidoreductase [Chloroflexota bacterium]
MNRFDLTGKRAIITGGAGDLGQALTRGLHAAGVTVAILDRSVRLDEFVASFDARVTGIRVDLTQRDELARAFGRALESLGGLDILVTAHGIQRRFPAEEFPLEVWDHIIETNLTSVFGICQMAGRVMLRQGRGKIINVASLNSFTGGITIPAYAASKGGVALLTKALSNEWAGKGICVNAIAPGYMATKMTAALQTDPVRNPQILARIPVGRWGTPDDLVGPMLFLASPASDYVTGEILPVDGGWMGR